MKEIARTIRQIIHDSRMIAGTVYKRSLSYRASRSSRHRAFITPGPLESVHPIRTNRASYPRFDPSFSERMVCA